MAKKTKIKITAPKALIALTLVFGSLAILAGLGITVWDIVADYMSDTSVIKAGLSNMIGGEGMIVIAMGAKLLAYVSILIAWIVALAKHDAKRAESLPFSTASLLFTSAIVGLTTIRTGAYGGLTASTGNIFQDILEIINRSRLFDPAGLLYVSVLFSVAWLFLDIAGGLGAKHKKGKAVMGMIGLLLFAGSIAFGIFFLHGDNTIADIFYLNRPLSDLLAGDDKAFRYINIGCYEYIPLFIAMIFAFITACKSEVEEVEVQPKIIVKTGEEDSKESNEEKKAEEEAPKQEEKKAEEPKKEEAKPEAKEEAKEQPKAEEPAPAVAAAAVASEPAEEQPAEEQPSEEKPAAQSRWNLGGSQPAQEEPAAQEEEKQPAPAAAPAPAVDEEPEEEPEEEEPVAEKKPAAKKAPAKKKSAEDFLTLKGKTYHVVKRIEDGVWSIKANKGQKALKLFPNKVEALKYAETLEAKGATILVHASKGANAGKIQKR